MMKKLMTILAAATALTACGRSRQIAEAGLTVDNFLTAYCQGEDSAAASYCIEPLKSHIADTPSVTANTDTAVTSAAVRFLENLSWQKEAVETAEETDDITFFCSTVYNGQSLSYTFTLTPVEKVWFISSIK